MLLENRSPAVAYGGSEPRLFEDGGKGGEYVLDNGLGHGFETPSLAGGKVKGVARG